MTTGRRNEHKDGIIVLVDPLACYSVTLLCPDHNKLAPQVKQRSIYCLHDDFDSTPQQTSSPTIHHAQWESDTRRVPCLLSV